MEWAAAPFIVTLVGLIVCAYFLYKLFPIIHVMLYIALGGSTSSSSHLHLYVCPIGKLDSTSFEELSNFLTRVSEVSLDYDTIRKILTAAYSHVMMVRRTTDGSLQGYIFYAKERGVLNGRKYTLFKIGPMVFNYNYRRSVLPLLFLVFHVLYELILHPTRLLFFAGKATTYKSYLSAISKTQYFHPRYDQQTPEFEKNLLHRFAESVCSPGEVYDRQTFVLKREVIKFNQSVAFITEEDMKNPHIRFFVEQNPGWTKGHSMFVIGRVTWWQVILLIRRCCTISQSKGVNGAARGSKREIESQLRKIMDRHLSFQTDLGKREVTDQYWVTPSNLQHRKLSNRTRLDSSEEMDEYDEINL